MYIMEKFQWENTEKFIIFLYPHQQHFTDQHSLSTSAKKQFLELLHHCLRLEPIIIVVAKFIVFFGLNLYFVITLC